MLKFSKHAKAASTGRLSPESRDVKKQKLYNIPEKKSYDIQETPECKTKCKEKSPEAPWTTSLKTLKKKPTHMHS